MNTTFQVQAPHEEAAALIRGKPVVTRQVFDQLLPELRGRAFTITGVEGANVQQRVRDAIAGVATGDTWESARQEIAAQMEPYLGEEGAGTRAELLLRTHAFQAFQAAQWRVAQEDLDTTHLQYLTMEDDHVRDSHAALNGIVLPKDDPFWAKHFPPWDWGCRCMAVPMNPDAVEGERDADAQRNPEDRNVIEGPALSQLNHGTLIREGQRFDVTPPSDGPNGATAFQWNPRDLRIPLEQLQQRYDPEVWQSFEKFARGQEVGGKSLWNWLSEPARVPQTPTLMPVKAADVPAVPSQFTDFEKSMLQQGFSPKIASEALSLPTGVAPSVGRAHILLDNATATGHYSPSTKTVHMGGDPDQWNGRPGLLSHELGHHIHEDTNTINAFYIHPEFEAAMKKDLKAFKLLDKETPGIFGEFSCTSWVLQLYDNDWVKFKSEISRFCDTLGGLTKGKWGWGHEKSYYKEYNHGAMEAYGNCFAAIVQGDTVFQKHFPHLVEAVKSSFARSK